MKTCENCGHKIDGKSPICMHCGAAIADDDILQETKEKMKTNVDNQSESNPGTSVKAIGAALIIIGFFADVISMFLIFSDDFGSFGAVTIAGTISFLIGLALVANN